MVSDFDIGDTFADALDHTSALVAKDDWESALGIFTRQSVCVGVTNACIVYLYPHLMCLWWCDLNVFQDKVFAGLPSNSSFASDGLTFGGRHCEEGRARRRDAMN